MRAERARSLPADGAVVRPGSLDHVAVKTRRLREMKAWYCTVLGAEVLTEVPFATFLTYDPGSLRVALFGDERFAGDNTPQSIGLHHLAFYYPTIAELLQNWRAMGAHGIEPIWVTNHGATISFYYADPDGNNVEQAVSNGDFHHDPEVIQRNPLGVDVDPRLLLVAWESGATDASLFERSYAGEEFVPAEPWDGPGLKR